MTEKKCNLLSPDKKYSCSLAEGHHGKHEAYMPQITGELSLVSDWEYMGKIAFQGITKKALTAKASGKSNDAPLTESVHLSHPAAESRAPDKTPGLGRLAEGGAAMTQRQIGAIIIGQAKRAKVGLEMYQSALSEIERYAEMLQ